MPCQAGMPPDCRCQPWGSKAGMSPPALAPGSPPPLCCCCWPGEEVRQGLLPAPMPGELLWWLPSPPLLLLLPSELQTCWKPCEQAPRGQLLPLLLLPMLHILWMACQQHLWGHLLAAAAHQQQPGRQLLLLLLCCPPAPHPCCWRAALPAARPRLLWLWPQTQTHRSAPATAPDRLPGLQTG